MTKRHRIIAAVAGLALVILYFTPLWKITLEAPQYPEGLGLYITLTDVRGIGEFDLRNINNLNHYIGMKRIEPDAIPELRIMPWAIALIIVLALATAASGKRWVLTTWVFTFLVLAVAGLVDFWLWEYDYGHNLDLETAAIKVPGMSYQPPLIGSKQLLNFKAHSWPAAGGWIAFLSLFAGLWLWWDGRKAGRQKVSPVATSVLALIFAGVLAGCTPEPEPFHLGQDVGDYCRMTIDDGRYATQVVMKTGKVYKFDSIECMASFLEKIVEDENDVFGVWVSDAAQTGALLGSDEAIFVHHPSIRSPMGGGWAAYGTESAAKEALSMIPASDAGQILITDFEGMRSRITSL
jgi:copper chaperone NosL